MAKAIGLDISERGFKIIEVEGSAKKFKVTRFIVRDLETHFESEVAWDQVVEELRATWREEKLPKEPVVASIGAGDAILREIQIPFKTDDQIRKVIRFEAENHIQHLSIDDIVLAHHKSGEVGDKSSVLVFAVAKDAIEKRLGHLSRGGLDPQHLDLDPLALYNTVTITDLPEKHKNLAVIEIGAAHTTLLVLHEGNLVSARCIRMGSGSISHSISRDLQIGSVEAEAKKLELLAVGGGGASSVAEVLPAMVTEDHVVLEDSDDEKPEIEKSPEELESELVTRSRDDFLAKLHRELMRSLVRIPSVSKLDAIMLTGGGCRIRGVKEYLKENFAKTVEVLNPLEEIGSDLSPEEVGELGPRAAISLGLAAKVLGHDKLGTDFRQDEFKYLRRFDQIKVALASCISLILILFCFMGAFFWNQYMVAKTPYQAIEARARALYAKYDKGVYGALPEGRFEAIDKIKNRIKVDFDDLSNELGTSKNIPVVPPAVDPLLTFFNDFVAVESRIEGVILDSVSVDARTIKITGWVPEGNYLDRLKNQIEKNMKGHGLFLEVKPGRTKSTESGLIRFEGFEIVRPDMEKK